MKTKCIIVALALCEAVFGQSTLEQRGPHVFVATVAEVVDGDSFVVEYEDEKITVRIEGIDAPELHQPFGERSKSELRKMLPIGATVVVEDLMRGKYGRVIANVHHRKVTKDSIGLAMVRQGFAWHFRKYNKDQLLARAQDVAKSKRMGLWKADKPIRPYEYRVDQDRGEVMQPESVHKPSEEYERRRRDARNGYWLNTDGLQRHLVGCVHAEHGKGRPAREYEGRSCPVCCPGQSPQ